MGTACFRKVLVDNVVSFVGGGLQKQPDQRSRDWALWGVCMKWLLKDLYTIS